MEIFPAPQKKIWPALRPIQHLGFVLYGGTAIALRLGHRTSVDFDFFTEQLLDKENLFTSLSFLKNGMVVQDGSETLTVLLAPEGPSQTPVKISFFGSITIGRVGEPESTEDGVLQVASLKDLLALKLKVILQRVESKDYTDINALLGGGLSLAEGLSAARALYGSLFQPAESLKALVYFEGGDLESLNVAERQTLITRVRQVEKIPEIKRISLRLSL